MWIVGCFPRFQSFASPSFSIFSACFLCRFESLCLVEVLCCLLVVVGIRCQQKESIIYRLSSFHCWCFNSPSKTQSFCQKLRFLLRNLPLIFQVCFVANKHYVVSIVSEWVINKVGNLILNLVKGGTWGDIICSDTPVRISVVCLRYWLKTFLARSVPNLQFSNFTLNLEGFYSEINSYSAQVCLFKSFFDKAEQKRSFAAIARTNQDHFEKHGFLFHVVTLWSLIWGKLTATNARTYTQAGRMGLLFGYSFPNLCQSGFLFVLVKLFKLAEGFCGTNYRRCGLIFKN